VGEKLVICLASTLNLDGTPSSATFDAVGGGNRLLRLPDCCLIAAPA